ncbi:triose-phosphate isomerase [Guggenheimella bovis]
MRYKMIAGNWKMNHTNQTAKEFLKELGDLSDVQDRVVICPPYIALQDMVELSDVPIEIAAQNVHFKDTGAYTGEVSVEMLQDIGVQMSIIGHSERRQYYNETDEALKEKVLKAVQKDFEVILCVGESLEERESGQAEAVVKRQLLTDLELIESDSTHLVNIAYEPIWAIGTGKSATNEDAESMCRFIRETIEERFGKEAGETMTILYGGSVKPETIDGLMSEPNIDGVLVGGASLNPESFLRLIHYKK